MSQLRLESFSWPLNSPSEWLVAGHEVGEENGRQENVSNSFVVMNG